MVLKRLSLFLVIALAAAGEKRAITHEDVFLMKRTGEPAVSPDGKTLVFSVVEPSYDAAKQVSDLWVAPADGSHPAQRLTATRAPESAVAWSPDSTRIAFVTRRDGDESAQVYVLAMNGGEAQRVTNAAAGAGNPQWRPDGAALLYESEFDPMADSRKARKWNARVYDTFPIRYWNAWLDEKRPHIFVQGLAPGAVAVDVLKDTKMAGLAGFAGQFNPTGGGQSLDAIWAPDGKSIVFTAYVNRDATMYAETESHLYVVAGEGGEPRRLTQPGQSFSSPKFSPKGDALYALNQKNSVPGGRLYSLARLVALAWPEAASARFLSPQWDRSVSGFSIAADGATLYVDAEDDGFDQLFSLPAAGGQPRRLFEVKAGGYTGVKPVAGGLIARYQTAAQPPEIVRLNPERAMHAYLTMFNNDRLAQIETTEPVHFWFTAKNGRRIHSLLFLPPFFDKGKRYPIVAFPHGGPNSMSKDAYSTRWNSHFLAAPGYVVIETDYSGSTGFGEKFADDVERDVLRGPAGEILEAIEEAARRFAYIDKSRQAAVGASYGGYLMNWFNGHTRQFRCLVNHAGAMNNESQYGANDGGFDRELRMGGPVWEKGGQWNDQSPIRYAGAFRTPMLITQGELDYRVPLNESMTTFKLLQRLRVPVRLVTFPDEGHWVLKGENSRKHMEEVMGWLKRYLD